MIYFDNNATTPLDPLVLEAMTPFLTEFYGNPSSPYTFARHASNALAGAREKVASLCGVLPHQVLFTSGGTESNNTALTAALDLRPGRKKIVTTTTEHPSVARVCNRLEANGLEIIQIGVSGDGQLDFPSLEKALDDHTALLSVMTANNETGLLFPMEEIGVLAKERNILLHTDAVQAAGKIPVSPGKWQADFTSLSAHKLYGPKGVGALLIRIEEDLPPLLHGGDQEQGRRSGTENVPGIVGFGKAAELAEQRLSLFETDVSSLRDYLEEEMHRRVPGITFIGKNQPRLPNTTTLLFNEMESEAILARLDMEDICCSSGSACSAGSVEPSKVLLGMGYTPKEAQGAIRFSLSHLNSKDEVDTALEKTVKICEELTGISPGAA